MCVCVRVCVCVFVIRKETQRRIEGERLRQRWKKTESAIHLPGKPEMFAYILFSDFQEAVQDEEKGKKKKIKTMETIKEETLSALRAFLTPGAEDDE